MWLQSLQENVGRDFEDGITDEEYRQTYIILRIGHFQVRHQLSLILISEWGNTPWILALPIFVLSRKERR